MEKVITSSAPITAIFASYQRFIKTSLSVEFDINNPKKSLWRGALSYLLAETPASRSALRITSFASSLTLASFLPFPPPSENTAALAPPKSQPPPHVDNSICAFVELESFAESPIGQYQQYPKSYWKMMSWHHSKPLFWPANRTSFYPLTRQETLESVNDANECFYFSYKHQSNAALASLLWR